MNEKIESGHALTIKNDSHKQECTAAWKLYAVQKQKSKRNRKMNERIKSGHALTKKNNSHQARVHTQKLWAVWKKKLKRIENWTKESKVDMHWQKRTILIKQQCTHKNYELSEKKTKENRKKKVDMHKLLRMIAIKHIFISSSIVLRYSFSWYMQ